MFCKNCGAQLSDAARFCSRCGRARSVTPPVQPVIPPTAPLEHPTTILTPPAEPVGFADKVRATAKKVGSSPMFLFATICFTLVQVLELLFLRFDGTLESYAELFAEFGIYYHDLPISLESFFLASSIISMLPRILIVIGLWITYGSCVSRKKAANTSGLTMIFVANLMQLVFVCLILLAALLSLIILYNSADNLFGTDKDILEAVLLIVGVMLLAVFAFLLLHSIKVCTTVSNVRSTLKTGIPNKRASRFVAVMCFISSGFMVLSLLGSFLGVILFNEALPVYTLITIVSSLLTAVLEILFGVLIFSYRSKMASLEAEARLNSFKTLSYAAPYTAPVYIPPQPVTVTEPEYTPEIKEVADSEEIPAYTVITQPEEGMETESVEEPESVTELIVEDN